MISRVFLLSCLIAGTSCTSFAQEGSVGLRGALPAEANAADSDNSLSQARLGAEQSNSLVSAQSTAQGGNATILSGEDAVETEGNDLSSGQEAIAQGRLNAAVAESGSTGLTGGSMTQTARPFADRVAAVRRLLPTGQDRRTIDDNIFLGDTTYDAGEGIQARTFTLRPELTIGGGWNNNRQGTAYGTGGGQVSIQPDIQLLSNWDRHELDLALRGSYTAYSGGDVDNDPNLTASGVLRLDLPGETTLTSEGTYSYSQEDNSSAENPNGDVYVQGTRGSVALARSAGALGLTLRGDIDHEGYSSDDGDSGDRDNTLVKGAIRVSGLTGAIFQPYTEIALLGRYYDTSCKTSGCLDRNSAGYELRGGLTINTGSKITGEVGIGWHTENLEEPFLKHLEGMILNGTMVWSPTRRTTVSAGLDTSFDATNVSDASGSVIYSGDLRVAHEFSPRFVGEVGMGYSYRTYQGDYLQEKTTSALGGVTYALTKNVALTSRYTYRWFDSSDEGADYNENIIEAGVRIRH